MKRRSSLAIGALLSAGLVSAGLAALAQDDSGDAVSSLAKKRLIDEFNPSVKNKENGDGEPVPGGQIRIRIPVEPKSLNRPIENGVQARSITYLMMSRLVDFDNETFERLPQIARYWEERDIVLLKPVKDGDTPARLEGRIVEEGKDGVKIAMGAGTFTLNKHELKSYDKAAGTAVTKDLVIVKDGGRTYFGALKKNEGGAVVLGVDMPWQPKADKSFKADEVTVVPSKTYKGAIEDGITGVESSYTIRVATTTDDIKTVPMDAIFLEETRVGKRTRQVPAVKRGVVMYFHMRDGVRWHDGKPVTVDDVTFSLNDVILNDTVDCADLRSYYLNVIDCSKAGPKTVRFEYREQYFRALTFCSEVPLVPKHLFKLENFKGDPESFGDSFNKDEFRFKPVYTGPYKFSKWEKGLQIQVVRNEDWWARTAGLPYVNPQQPYLDKITWVVINDKNASLKQLGKGEIDADFDIEPLTWRDPDTQSADFTKNVVRAKFLQPLYTYIGWNQDRKGVDAKKQFFKDKNVRTAMTMLIPRDSILNEIHGGLGEQVNGPFYRYGPFHSDKVRTVPYDPERAKVLLDRSGWVDHDGDGIRDKDGVKFEFEYLIHNARAYHQKIADKIKESVEQAGVKMSIRKIDWRVFQDTVRDHKFDAVRFAWGEPSCIETDPYQIWHSSQSDKGSNYISFNNEKADEIILRARRTLDFTKRQRLLRRFHKIVADDQPYTFLFNFYTLHFYNRRYRNVKYYVIGEDCYNLLEWYVPKELQGK